MAVLNAARAPASTWSACSAPDSRPWPPVPRESASTPPGRLVALPEARERGDAAATVDADTARCGPAGADVARRRCVSSAADCVPRPQRAVVREPRPRLAPAPRRCPLDSVHAAVRSGIGPHRRRRAERLRRPRRQPERDRRRRHRPDRRSRDRDGGERGGHRRGDPGLASRVHAALRQGRRASGRSTASPIRGARRCTRICDSRSARPSSARAPTARTAIPGSRCATRSPGRRSPRSSRRSCATPASAAWWSSGWRPTIASRRPRSTPDASGSRPRCSPTPSPRSISSPGDGERAIEAMADAGVTLWRTVMR